MEKIRNYSEDEYGLFIMSELTKIEDIELTILKGHIFTEFTLNCYLESISTNNDSNFFKENFSYSAKTKLLRLFGELNTNKGELIIKSLNVLNKLRNTIAHSLDVNEQLIVEFLAILRKISPNKGNFNNTDSPILYRLEGGIAFICGIIFSRYCINRNKKTKPNTV
ncbi:hypothetical protein [Polaribacter butkevichii]|uniref:DUF4145 domain-containing protein n=1 Tax=Polaribacter butkevichii TaxID=218490 RepID=A0A2P6CFI3_9FLAO|nr:hypothetical protein [Polaribacter butkevichii]PQJ73626.1 hypothetical protein BTO14_10255 [Polaribacter butkevichii]